MFITQHHNHPVSTDQLERKQKKFYQSDMNNYDVITRDGYLVSHDNFIYIYDSVRHENTYYKCYLRTCNARGKLYRNTFFPTREHNHIKSTDIPAQKQKKIRQPDKINYEIIKSPDGKNHLVGHENFVYQYYFCEGETMHYRCIHTRSGRPCKGRGTLYSGIFTLYRNHNHIPSGLPEREQTVPVSNERAMHYPTAEPAVTHNSVANGSVYEPQYILPDITVPPLEGEIDSIYNHTQLQSYAPGLTQHYRVWVLG